MNPVLEAERKALKFDPRELSYNVIGREQVEKIERVRRLVENDPIFSKRERPWLDRSEFYKRCLRKSARAFMLMKEHKLDKEECSLLMDFIGEFSPFSLHFSMFLPTIEGQATEEQKAKWLPLAQEMKIIGTYAQTELGHGTFLRGLETTATYDDKTQEFVLHSPSITASKWWPGGLGKTSNVAIVMARLITKGKDYGMHAFFVQLRSFADHRPLPGVTLGDIGPKLGFNSNDNGFLMFNQVRIPRTNMLMRYAQITPEGEYRKPPHSKLSYGTMIGVRNGIVAGAYYSLASAATIAVRYSLVRSQGVPEGVKEGTVPETKVLDYKLQQYRVLPLVAQAYALKFTGANMNAAYQALMAAMKKDDFSALPEVHATAAGLKALSTSMTESGIEAARKACGGHGYSQFSGLPFLWAEYVPSCTYEGENGVMALQAARFLVKSLRQTQAGKALTGSVAYLQHWREMDGEVCGDASRLLETEVQDQIFRHRAIRLVQRAVKELDQLEAQFKNNKGEVLNQAQVYYTQASEAHCVYYMVRSFHTALKNLAQRKIDAVQLSVLKTVSDLFALTQLEKCMGDLYEDGFFKPQHAAGVRATIQSLLLALRPHAIGLVDAFNISDFELHSSLGRYDGRVYEHMFQWAKESPLNRTEVVEGYELYLKPLMQRDGPIMSKL